MLKEDDSAHACKWNHDDSDLGSSDEEDYDSDLESSDEEEDYDECNDLRKNECSEPCEWQKGVGRGSKGICITSEEEELDEDYDECNDLRKNECRKPCYWEKGVGRGSKGICKERDQSKSRVNCVSFTTNSGKKCPECCSAHTDDCQWIKGSKGRKGKCIDA